MKGRRRGRKKTHQNLTNIWYSFLFERWSTKIRL